MILRLRQGTGGRGIFPLGLVAGAELRRSLRPPGRDAAQQGYLRDAVRLLEQAVQHAPNEARYAERLEAYRTLFASQNESPTRSVGEVPSTASTSMPSRPAAGAWEEGSKIAGVDWAELGERLTRDGVVLIRGLLDGSTCASLRSMFDEDARFAKTVVMSREDFGQGIYRYFRAPIPVVVDQLRRAMYPYLARIANESQRLLNEPEEFPQDWEAFRRQCADAGQTTPTPILLKYGPGGFNALHRDLRGSSSSRFSWPSY